MPNKILLLEAASDVTQILITVTVQRSTKHLETRVGNQFSFELEASWTNTWAHNKIELFYWTWT